MWLGKDFTFLYNADPELHRAYAAVGVSISDIIVTVVLWNHQTVKKQLCVCEDLRRESTTSSTFQSTLACLVFHVHVTSICSHALHTQYKHQSTLARLVFRVHVTSICSHALQTHNPNTYISQTSLHLAGLLPNGLQKNLWILLALCSNNLHVLLEAKPTLSVYAGQTQSRRL